VEFQGTVGDKERGFRERDAEQNRLDQLRDKYYGLDWCPSAVYNQSTTLVNNGGLPTSSFATGATNRLRFGCPKPALWRKGKVKLELWCSTDNTDVTTVSLDTVVAGYEEDKNTTAGKTSLINTTINVTPSGTANKVQKVSVTGATSITNVMKLISGDIQRNDANPDVFYIHGIRLIFLPENRQ